MDVSSVTDPQPSTPPRDEQLKWLAFSGAASENVLVFAQAVYRLAFARGRQQDGVWMAGYAYGCLVDAALEWHEDLAPELKQDWSQLRLAMVKRFRQDRSVAVPPTAAAGPRL